MKRPLQIYVAITLLLGLGLSRLWMIIGAVSVLHAGQLAQPVLMLSGALWMMIHPRSARWVVGLYFAAGALKEAFVFPTFSGSTMDLIRRPFSMVVAAWLAWTLLFGRGTRAYLTRSESPNPLSPPPDAAG